MSRSSINWCVCTDLQHNDSLAARPTTPYSPCLAAVFSWPEQKARYPAGRNVVLPDLQVLSTPMKSQPSCWPFASTHSSCPYPFSSFTARCAHCSSLLPQVPPAVSYVPHVLMFLPADVRLVPASCFCLFCFFLLYDKGGSPFCSPVRALVSVGWAQPSQPTPILASFLSCMCARTVASLSIPQLPI